MLNDAKNKLRTYAQILVILGGIFGLLLCFSITTFMKNGSLGGVGFLIGLLVGGSWFLTTLVMCWFITCFADMANELEIHSQLLRQMVERLEKPTGRPEPIVNEAKPQYAPSGSPSQPQYGSSGSPSQPQSVPISRPSQPVKDVKNRGKEAHFPTRPRGTNGTYTELICPLCNRKQRSDRTRCFQCEALFIFDDEVTV